MTSEEKISKIHEIKETVSYAAEMMRHMGESETRDSLGKIMETGKLAKELIEVLRTPEMVRNIENMTLITANIAEAATKMHSSLKILEDAGFIRDANMLITSALGVMNIVELARYDAREISIAVKSVLKSVNVLVHGLQR